MRGIIEVVSEESWEVLEAVAPFLKDCTAQTSTRRSVPHQRMQELAHTLKEADLRFCKRTYRRPIVEEIASREHLAIVVSSLPKEVRVLLHRAQRQALGRQFVSWQVADPKHHSDPLRILAASEAICFLGDHRYELNGELKPPPKIHYDFEEAVMERVPDLSEPTGVQPQLLLNDIASLAAALSVVSVKRTLKGAFTKVSCRALADWMGAPELRDGLETSERWNLAFTALQSLDALEFEGLGRTISVGLSLQEVLAEDEGRSVDSLLHRLVEPDQHPLLPAVRAALQQCKDGAIDSMIFIDELRLQHRDILFCPWWRDAEIYPLIDDRSAPLPWDEQGWERMEAHLIERVLKRLHRVGVLVLADGVFAASPAGEVWARGSKVQTKQVYITSDLQVMVPPQSITSLQRYQLERVCRCLQRDTVDRFQITREGVGRWIGHSDLASLLNLFEAIAVFVPVEVKNLLEQWASQHTRIQLIFSVPT